MKNLKSIVYLLVIVALLLGLSVPFQYLARKDVVVGMASEHAHAHEHKHEGGEDENEHEHTNEEDHPAADMPLGTNLISNFGFEVGTREQIWGWASTGKDQGAMMYRDDSISHQGMASAAVDTKGASVLGTGWVMKLDEPPVAHDVLVEGYIRSEGLMGEAYLMILAEGKEPGSEETHLLVRASTDEVSGTSDWTLSELHCYIPPEATGVWLEIGVYGHGKAWFDDVSLVVEDRENTLRSGEGLLENPDFDEGLDHWHLFTNTEGPVLGYGTVPLETEGNNALVLRDDTLDSTQDLLSEFSQSICGLYGHQGTLEIKGVMSGKEIDGRAWISVSVLKASGAVEWIVSKEFTGYASWVGFTNQVPIDEDVASVLVSVKLEGNGTIYVDYLDARFLE
ncbi:MAG: hypothetical protein SWK76_12890 [Actinomycetota bacterium]|nr:hypothetical protein [Actinomycetota bacterium]